jgi:adenylyltransferase/sulfurtransferase
MSQAPPTPLSLREGRFARLEAIEWWDQDRLRNARILVVGAGALGNEVIKNLALLGVGNVIIADMDRIELSNLSRSVLFRETDEGKSKAERAAAAASNIYPEMNVLPVVGNLLAGVGLGCFRWADAVIGALDNREARVFVNAACAQVGTPWVDGGIEVLRGIVRGFSPPETACYECTMSTVDWDLLNKRRSCSLLARRAIAELGTPTTPTTASVIGALEVQEIVKLLHGREALMGRGWVFDGGNHDSYTVSYPVDPACSWHEEPSPVEELPDMDSNTVLQVIWDLASQKLGGVDALDLSRELVQRLGCTQCGETEEIFQSAEAIDPDRIPCPKCGTERQPTFFHSIGESRGLLSRTVREIGLPPWDILWARRGGRTLGFELSGDNLFRELEKEDQR